MHEYYILMYVAKKLRSEKTMGYCMPIESYTYVKELLHDLTLPMQAWQTKSWLEFEQSNARPAGDHGRLFNRYSTIFQSAPDLTH